MRWLIQQADFIFYLFFHRLSGFFGNLSRNMGHRSLAHLVAGNLQRRLPADLANYVQVIVSVNPQGQAMVTTVVVVGSDLEKAQGKFEKENNVKVIFFESMNSMLHEAVKAIALGEEKYL